jgi:hypothetical protein
LEEKIRRERSTIRRKEKSLKKNRKGRFFKHGETMGPKERRLVQLENLFIFLI